MFFRSFAATLIVLAIVASSWRSTSSARAPSKPYVVVIVIDGFRPDYLSLARMPHLRWLMSRGMTYDTAWTGQMESETPPGHATIATGVYPRTHGVTGFGWRDPVTKRFTWMPTNFKQIAAGDLSRLVNQGGVASVSDLLHRSNRKDLSISISGEKLWASAPMGVGADYVLYGKVTSTKFRAYASGPNIPPPRTHYSSVTEINGSFDYQDHFAATLSIRLVRTLRPRLLLLNLPATDLAGHYYGGMHDPPDMARIVAKADAAIGRVIDTYRRMGLLKRTVFLVTADHGMVFNRHIVPIQPIYKAVDREVGQSLETELRISAGSIWLPDPGQAKRLASALASKHYNGVEGALYKVPAGSGWRFEAEASTAKRLGPTLLKAYLHLADTEASLNGPDVILPYGENTSGFQQHGKRREGDHGGFSWRSQHIPLVLAGPGVRHGVSHFPAQLVDIAPTLQAVLALHVPSRVDGVVLSDSLKTSAVSAHLTEHGVARSRLTDVRVLQAHSAAQSR